MEWLIDNWIWILLLGGCLLMHFTMHGGHGSHGGHTGGRGDDSDHFGDEASHERPGTGDREGGR